MEMSVSLEFLNRYAWLGPRFCYLVAVIFTEVDIAAYAPFFVVLKRSVQLPFFVGITIFAPRRRQLPFVTRQVFVPFDGVVTIEDNFTVFFTLNAVDLT